MIKANIFKAYDIRGIVGQELDEQGAYIIGRAYGVFMKDTHPSKKLFAVVVQADAREHSPRLKNGLIEGLIAEHINIIDGGLATTPMHYFSVNHAGADGGIMVTASHNPASYNGFKLTRRGAVPIGKDSGMEEIKQIALRGIFDKEDKKGSEKNLSHKQDFKKPYIDFLLEHISVSSVKPFRVVIDTGNGMVGHVLPLLLKRLPIEVFPLYFDIDMRFPYHTANPLDTSTLKDLIAKVLEVQADFGIAFDGDGDRIGFVDENGRIVQNDLITAFLADSMLKKHKGGKIVYDLRSSRIVPETIASNGGAALESKVGHAFIKSLMRKENAVFGGELSGHYYFKDFFFADSALFAFLYFLEILSLQKMPFSSVVAPYRAYVSSGEINFQVGSQETFLEGIALHFKDAKKLYWLDGLTVTYDDWWFNLRMSNTEPVARLNVEADNEWLLKENLENLKRLIEKS
ncbi:MAG: hypothetical protein A3C80_03455 [Candidatus Ryanbacteria bacterium RIFCSPHIGHO2_02_FULL_45_43]|uniref:Phosphomannomutase/phosphoglucomutase n=1 Tax=Candidatus Ryanbacteria bacterium RIFCSPHIGHO2_01_45_13 TaxID=1802112 RepID=A0A1G2FUS8_9BACT|nr:MAG: hypothetical protein A2W41_01400 [Candidatus Ryanbacteria bacterium RIFCSPHIGHO2_01_45_13]OGZ41517.1 MAG: hypothetical protein A2718_03720 [Candidatus Ryanbacteria bacterium RIFCSPHIGHO2_01_FULL_44_130]OGZ47984.1 MAG: hypothetical protein A3C80_03455 [Candidatus Ryanbacteria bacterium RIFCSPHIGHO2_02_FULL_45_43]OGZ50120.1 MAG: hypothetical protein A3E55_01320 [Candidatus Ryanbacteria bacterium RIFCSPHIGHO2_12_FULL_44_20]OGZ51122.1 MAG: hypothetical protein A3A17_03760 [Candidatus Ryanba